jgi:phosphoribosylformimino-5-aminoimidazole carboxamide ribotide isomerase
MVTNHVTRAFDILPAIDLRDGRVVRLEQGDFARETAFSDDPVGVARVFVDAGARWLHVVDLEGARFGTPRQAGIVAAIVAAVGQRTSVEVAGGLRDEASVAAVLASGAARAAVGTSALEDPAFAGRLITTHGAGRIAAAIDVRDGRAIGHGWQSGAPTLLATDAIRRLADVGVTIFEVTSIERDGLLEGPDLTLFEQLVRLERGAIIASGGIGTLGDVAAVRRTGAAGAIIGRAFYEGQIGLREALAAIATTG